MVRRATLASSPRFLDACILCPGTVEPWKGCCFKIYAASWKTMPQPLAGIFLSFFFFFFFYYFLNWNIITFQCCVSFYCIISWISQMNTYILSLLSLPPTPSHSTHLGHQRAVSWAPCAYSSFPLASYLTHGSIYICQCHSQFILPSPSPSVSTSLFSISVLLFLPWK